MKSDNIKRVITKDKKTHYENVDKILIKFRIKNNKTLTIND